jgi:glucokinase
MFGGQGLAGEVGHMIISNDIKAPLCGCGQKGCWEAFVGLKNFAENAQQWLEFEECEEPWYLNSKNSGQELRAEDIFSAALEKDYMSAVYLLRDWVSNMAVGIGNLVTNYNPSTIVLGTAAQYWGERLVEMIKREVSERFCGMKPQIEHCEIKANAITNINVMAPLAGAIRQHSKLWRAKNNDDI